MADEVGNPEEFVAEPTNKDLQAELVGLGMPEEDAQKINNKAALQAVINTLKASKVSSETTSVTPSSSLTPAPNPTEDRQVEKKWTSKAEKQWAYWDSLPKVRIMVPTTGKETQGVVQWVFDKKFNRELPVAVGGSVQTVIENGATYLIPKNVYVEVPEAVAKIIQDKFQQTSDAGKNLLIDRVDPETGKSVRDRL